jgi:hypothetical protein
MEAKGAMVDDVDDLTLIPRRVRDKLDRVGIKLHLREWGLLRYEERLLLRDGACDHPSEIESYRRRLEEIVRRHTGRPPERLGVKQADASASRGST